MNKIILLAPLLFSILFIVCCKNDQIEPKDENGLTITNDFLVDRFASAKTVALYQNLKAFSSDKVLIGHQDATAYGIGWVNDGTGSQSDIKQVAGDFPAVYGWDLGDIHLSENLDGVAFSEIRSLIKIGFERGGINTISLHLDNPITGENAWDNSAAVSKILPNATHHSKYLETLDLIADFLLSLKAEDGDFIPIILRPYHEHNHSWSWWGSSSCTEAEYIQLWKMTIDYLRDEKNIHHLLYAISPQDINSESEYLSRYPGDDYVDILGLDYYKLYDAQNIPHLQNALEVVAKLALQKNKISALTEIGIENVTIQSWWTDYLLTSLSANEETLKTAWVLVWRNKNETHHFGPYPGHSSASNFVELYQDSRTVFENDLIDLYR